MNDSSTAVNKINVQTSQIITKTKKIKQSNTKYIEYIHLYPTS